MIQVVMGRQQTARLDAHQVLHWIPGMTLSL